MRTDPHIGNARFFALFGALLVILALVWAASTVRSITTADAGPTVVSALSLSAGPLFMGGIGALFALSGGFVWRRAAADRTLRQWLRQHGQQVWVDLAQVQVDRDGGIGHHSRHLFVVTAIWVDPATSRTYTARSEYLRENPIPTLATRSWVRVLFDPRDPRKNFIDLD